VPGIVAPNRTLGGRYQLLQLIARGGMASVWEAHDRVLARRVAVKVLHHHLAADTAFLTRFRREAIAAAGLCHATIVATFDTGTDDGADYIVMELVDGTTLRSLLDERATLGETAAVDIAVQVADALAYAHARGIVHRDIKPANILIRSDGRVKVTDFGIAKAAGSGDLTRTGTVMGTAKYLAPEQVDGRPIDGRVDVYALGVVLYEMLGGAPPFAEATDLATAMARLNEHPAPLTIRCPTLSPAVDAAVQRALAREPDDRFLSATAFRDALAGPVPLVAHIVADATPPGGTPVAHLRRRARRGLLLGAAATGAVAVASVAALLVPDHSRAPRGAGAAPGHPVAITGAHDFDPFGDGQENGQLARLAIDGDAATAWRTARYNTPAFGGLKPGVGIVLDLAASASVHEVEVVADTDGWNGQIFVAPEATPALAGWGTPRATLNGADRTARFVLDPPARGRAVLLWLTRLPGTGRLGVDEVRVAS
jgi:serine/threonine-protein kinase